MSIGESYVKIYTRDKYIGIKCDVLIPSGVYANGYDYIDFYVGFDNKVEAGLSYSIVGWKNFINTGYGASEGNSNYWRSDVMLSQPNPGDRVSIELINNLDDTSTFKVNGEEYYTLPVFGGLSCATKVKQVHGCEDYTQTVKHNLASFSCLQIKNCYNTYIDWDDSVATKTPVTVNADDYYVYSYVPMSTKLNQG